MEVSNAELNSPHADDEIDLREVASAFRRRWIWIASGGFLGFAIAGISILTTPVGMPLKTIKMVVDIHQGPYAWTQRKLLKYDLQENLESSTPEFLSAFKILSRIASDELASAEVLSVKVQPLALGGKKDKNFLMGPNSSYSQLELIVEVESDKSDGLVPHIEKIKDRYASNRISDAKRLLPDVEAGEGWIFVEKSGPKTFSKSSSRRFVLGLLGGLVLGSGAALIADRRADRVFSHSKIFGQLGYPLWLTLPTLPWSDQVAGPLIGQLAARLDRSLEWRVLSIAHEHEVCAPLAQALTRQNEPELSCKSVAPLLNSVIRLSSDARPIGLLVVVESGFNSSQALEDARLLLSQLSCVQSIGLVLAGVPLPSELTELEKA